MIVNLSSDSQLHLSILATYQRWSGECVTNRARAFDIVYELRYAISNTSKKRAIDWIFRRGWSDKRSKIVELVDVLWDIKKIYLIPTDKRDCEVKP